MCLVFHLFEQFLHFLSFPLKFHRHFDLLWELGCLRRHILNKNIGVHKLLESIVEFDSLDNNEEAMEDVSVVGIPRRYEHLSNEFELPDGA